MAKLRSHFSPQTHISLLLPPDWEALETADFAAFYTPPTEPTPRPSLAIKVVRLQEAQPDSYKQLLSDIVQTTTERPDYTELTAENMLVGEQPAVSRTFKYYDAAKDITKVQRLVFSQVSDLIFMIYCTTVEQKAAQFLPVFEEALQSMRFIPTEQTSG